MLRGKERWREEEGRGGLNANGTEEGTRAGQASSMSKKCCRPEKDSKEMETPIQMKQVD